ncbi:MAG: hypothetical protein AAF752_15910, partial [Bacteroidota bacterium]
MRPLGFLVFLAALVFVEAVHAQPQTGVTVFNEYVTQPDVWRPADVPEPGVGAKGDLALSVPLLNVPGLGGLDFPVVLSYQSGIRVHQPSSWVGLGWSFDPGSIVRDVQAAAWDGERYGPDYDGIPAVQPDVYYVSGPELSFAMSRR